MEPVPESVEELRILRSKQGFSPLVTLVQWRDRTAVRKDYAHLRRHLQPALSRLMVARECRVLSALEGTEGVPRLLKQESAYSFIMEFAEGQSIGRYKEPGSLPDTYYASLVDLVNRMHRQGVVHLDLRQKKNILVSPDQKPLLIDFANGLVLRRGLTVYDWFFDWMARVDTGALLKFKNRIFPHLMTRKERNTLRRFNTIRRLWLFSPGKQRKRDRIGE